MTNDETANPRLEYDLIHRTRMNWTDVMVRWRNIVIPLSFSLIPISGIWNGNWYVVG